MPAPGWGAEFGSNYGGGGVIYLTGLNPEPGDLIPTGTNAIQLTIGVQGGLIDLSTVQISIAALPCFDGSTASFDPQFTGSSYEYSIPDNGYSFNIIAGFDYPATVSVVVQASTTDGGTTTQSYMVQAKPNVQYPPTPLGVPLTSIPLAEFTGEVRSGILAGGQGQVFFSPALQESNAGSQLDVDSVEVNVHAADKYEPDPKKTTNYRPFLWGPPLPTPSGRAYPPDMNNPGYLPVWNSWNAGPSQAPFVQLKTTQADATGVLTDVPTGKQTIILY
jgi:hypothetical protein